VGANAEIYRLLVDSPAPARHPADQSELEEVLWLSNRVGVMHDGHLAGILEPFRGHAGGREPARHGRCAVNAVA